MKIAICYYSMSENTQYAATEIARKIKENAKEQTTVDLIRIFPKKAYNDKGLMKFLWGGRSALMAETPELNPYDFKASDYDIILLGSPVWARTFAPPLRTFINENPEIAKKPVAVFFCQGGSGGDKALDKLKEALGVSTLKAQMVLNDPKDKPTAENEASVERFAAQICAD